MIPHIIEPIQALQNEMMTWRHHLHAHPETAFEEFETSNYIVEQLKSFGIESIYTGLAKTGVVAVIPGKKEGPWVGLRCEIDALDIQEENDLPYRSVYPGKMHACGHDGHSAMLLGAAKYLAATRDYAGTVALIFQPAEENEGGARVMVEEGLFQRFPIESIYGLHNRPNLPKGQFAIKTGAQMAAYDIFEITLSGVGGHAGMPHHSKDVLVGAGQLISALQSISSRNVNPLESSVVSVTQISGGSTWNVLPQEAILRGTVRTFNVEVQDLVEQRIRDIVAGISAAFGLQGHVHYERRYPAMCNAPDPTRIAIATAKTLVGEELVDTAPQSGMGAEDFAFFQKVIPGAYIWLGSGSPCKQHNQHYDFNDDILTLGAAYWVALVKKILG